MKIVVKTIKGETFDLEIQTTDTVLQLKQKIEAAKGFPINTQKLIFKGVQLTNEGETVDNLKIKEGDFIVVMSFKPPVVQQQHPKPEEVKKDEQKVKEPEKKNLI